MTSIGWRLRLWARRLLPHTPLKRWAYAVAAVAALTPAAFGWPLAALGLALGVLALRILDVALRRRRDLRIPTSHAYFFEGHDPLSPRQRR